MRMRSGFLLIALLGADCAASPPEPERHEPQWTLKFTNAFRNADTAKGMAYVRIEKVEPGVGKVSAKHVQYEGDWIGRWPEAPDGEPVTVHQVKLPDGKSEMVNFDTGLRLKSVVPVKKVIQVKRCKPIYNKADGDQVGCERILENRTFECYEVTYAAGVVIHRAYVPEPTTLNQSCRVHQWNPDVEITEERVQAARTLLKQADQLWTTDAVEATKIYERLLKEYMECGIIFEVRKKVESRARAADK